jgi:hypothetical protein
MVTLTQKFKLAFASICEFFSQPPLEWEIDIESLSAVQQLRKVSLADVLRVAEAKRIAHVKRLRKTHLGAAVWRMSTQPSNRIARVTLDVILLDYADVEAYT